VVFVIDNSAAVDSISFELTKTFLENLILNLDIDNDHVRVAMVTYASTVLPRFGLTSYGTRADLINAIAALQYSMSGGPSAATAGALNYVRQVSVTFIIIYAIVVRQIVSLIVRIMRGLSASLFGRVGCIGGGGGPDRTASATHHLAL